MKPPDHAMCPCHSGNSYAACCAPWHRGEPAPDAITLMRSRYCAYALGTADYVMATTCVHGPAYQADAAAWRADISQFSSSTQFLGLDIIEAQLGADVSHVTFQALLSQNKKHVRMLERSRFRRKAGRWCYLSGEPLDEQM